MNSMLARFALPVLIVLGSPPVSAAVPQQNCRFIQAKADREACYKRQEDVIASKRKPAALGDDSRTLESLHQMRQDDEAVYRSINNICRGC
jgi:hypothetical protein